MTPSTLKDTLRIARRFGLRVTSAHRRGVHAQLTAAIISAAVTS